MIVGLELDELDTAAVTLGLTKGMLLMILICGLDDLVEEATDEDDEVTIALAPVTAELLLTTPVAMAATAGTTAVGFEV